MPPGLMPPTHPPPQQQQQKEGGEGVEQQQQQQQQQQQNQKQKQQQQQQQAASNSSSSSKQHPPPMRTTPGGVVFTCNVQTHATCMDLGLLGAPSTSPQARSPVCTGWVCFLLNLSNMRMYGPFVAARVSESVGSRWWGMPGPGGGVSHPTLSRFRQLRVCAILSLKICGKAQWSGSHQGMEESHMWPHSCQRCWRSGWRAGSRTMENHTELALMCCTSYISIHVKVKMYLKVIVLSMLVVSCVQKLK